MSTLKIAAQSALLKSSANIVAQLAAGWHDSSPRPLDWQRVLEFAIFGLIQAQLNCWWQQFLEDAFPTRPTDKAPTTTSSQVAPGVNWRNVACKLLLDQTLGLFIMNTAFLVCTNAVHLQSATLVLQAVREKIFGVIRAAWKLWPWVSIANFLWVPVEKRVLVASCVGFGWNIFLAFEVMAK